MTLKLLILFIVIQFLVLLTLAIVPFGFDKPSAFGLDFDDFLVLVVFYCLALTCGVVTAGAHKRWWLVAVQILVAAAAASIFFWPWIRGDQGNHPPVPPDIQA